MAEKFRDLAKTQSSSFDALVSEYENLLINSFKILKNDEPINFITENYIKKTIISNGTIGYDKITDDFYRVKGCGRNNKGDFITLLFLTENGKSFTREASYEATKSGAYIIKGTPTGTPLINIINQSCKLINSCNEAIFQNIEACKSPFVAILENDELKESFELALKQKQDGEPIILVSSALGEAMKVLNLQVQFLADKFNVLKGEFKNELLTKLGIMNANTDKRERVQVGEVNATLGQCLDYLYLLIDTFNKQCETYEIPYKMIINSSIEELYVDENGGDDIGQQ